MDGATTGTYGQDYNAANQGAAPVTDQKRSLTDKVKGLLGGNKHHPNDGTAATDQTTDQAGTGTTAPAQTQGGTYGDAATGANETQGTGSNVGFFDKIKAKVGKGHAGATGSGLAADQNPEGEAYGTNATGPAAAGGAAPRSESSPYGSTGVGPTSGTRTGIDSTAASGPGTDPGYAHRSESSPYGASGVGPTSGTVQPGSGPPGSAGGYGQGQDVRTEASPYDGAGANPQATFNPQDGTGSGAPPTGPPGYDNNRQTGTGTGYTGGAPGGAAGYDNNYNQQTGTGYTGAGAPGGAAGYDNNSNQQTGTGYTGAGAPGGAAGHDNNYNQQTGTGYTGAGAPGAGGGGYGGNGNKQSTGLSGGWPQPTPPGGASHAPQGGPAAGATTFTDPQGNDNVKKEGFVSKIMDKIHSPKTKAQPTANAPGGNGPY
ncbi:hypothetical protein CY35_13G077300 [Sphagnum magellanicum]|nr:hypothetical protein CY35_13G077300 [Sphagnum magellanicum]